MAVRMNPYLILNGNGREAIAFYEKALGAQVLGVMTFGEMPPNPDHPTPDEVKDRIMHAHLKVGESDLMLSDTMPGMEHQAGNHLNISVVTDDADQSRRIFDALAEGGQVTMPMQQTFWSPAYGQVTDRFGVPWQVMTQAKS